MEPLLKESNIISFHIPLTPSTEKIIGTREFARMKKSAILINRWFINNRLIFIQKIHMLARCVGFGSLYESKLRKRVHPKMKYQPAKRVRPIKQYPNIIKKTES
ncbi:MAG TPA: NAD(P)-dependent oxidoreductase [Methanosarcina sp.]|nr:NAD(P)-dependent oxidoreductase [Methanosarcina sp.]